MSRLQCVLCELNDGFAEPVFPHEHVNGQIPLTPCPQCMVNNHGRCVPDEPYWCTCDCGLDPDEAP